MLQFISLEEAQALREHNQQLQHEIARLQASLPAGSHSQSLPPEIQEMLLLDLAHVLIRDMESRIVFWNRGAELLYGWTQAEALGEVSHTLLGTVFPESQEAIHAALCCDGEWEGELLHVCRNGAQIVVASHQVLHRDSQGQPVAVFEINNDITKHRRVEEARLHLAAIVDSSQDAILSKTLDGVISSWNRGAERLYGYTRQEAIGQPITLIVPPERTDELSPIFCRLGDGEAIEPFETVRMRKDGTHIVVSVQMSPIRTQDGKSSAPPQSPEISPSASMPKNRCGSFTWKRQPDR
jgi:two-component system NtrC family sensor kinase